MEKHLDPARSVIAKLGGPEVVRTITGKSLTRIYRWMYPASRGGTDGIIPHLEARKMLEHAKANDIALTPLDFFPPIMGDRAETAEKAEAAA
ncbi:hypothetical protein [Kaistia nematophila]|uniref:Uncharacterized protein n=1 Tax=Kaistia nematophila TaxID=2994654 RepID=A0A9X3IKI2_9HYPH|nr:hypothetical protein [Kaistia nematophila]MCX5569629.1 hypothetical protein [Kaistia nematophila]